MVQRVHDEELEKKETHELKGKRVGLYLSVVSKLKIIKNKGLRSSVLHPKFQTLSLLFTFNR